ncbi:unnamed protein product [Bursaphelenchus okinawaensis]|uniref:Nuclear receptor domain-containing protein n=1 Tax=Bursaphelenchus okinawaensis TaxID=465554 RepID=A0A811KRG3_9BILA|nr:unnamed protein product [Bursaphelenchus okinawaensis]CAG9109696.1 unnamed protein product [Bursaphelenchus okinawaensis]
MSIDTTSRASVSTIEDSPQSLCRICGANADGPHFGAYACRACSAFFRRSIVEHRRYKCNHKGKCSVNSDVRNSCRSCRYATCLAVGMKADTKFPENVLQDKEEMMVLTVEDKVKIDCDVLPTLYKVLRDYFCCYVKIGQEHKIELLTQFFQYIRTLESAYLTSIIFPDQPDAVAFSRSDYCDRKSLAIRFKNTIDPGQRIKTFTPARLQLVRVIQKVKRLKMDQTEMLLLLAIMINRDIYEKHQTEPVTEEREKLHQELYQHCQSKGQDKAEIRYVQLLLMVRDIEESCAIGRECICMAVINDDFVNETVVRLRQIIDQSGD